ncbi:MAG: hypothetical protein IPN83_06905 [Holophagales bacterium]|nr:hypothetical protein [Holophagales bacterium]
MIRSATLPVLLLLSAPMQVALASDPASPAGESLGSLRLDSVQTLAASPMVNRFLQAVRADKFQVTPGGLFKPNVLQMVCLGLITSCNGNNSSNPYLVVSVPEPGKPWIPTRPDLLFAIRQDEAIVLIGRTPPPLAYFSFRTFSFNRWVERESLRRKVFPSLGDPNNMLTFNTLGKTRGDPFDRAFVLAIVSDRGTEVRVRRALKIAGFPDAIINTDVISPNIARMSSKENGDPDLAKDDDFTGIMRFALWDYGFEEAGAAYLAQPPVAVFRLTPDPRTEKAKYLPLPVERLRPRGTGQTELDLTPEVASLRKAIAARYPEMKGDDLRPATWLEESFVGLQRDIDVLGESRDTVYLRNEGTFSLADDEFAIVYGVNHERTGKATYSNFAVYDACNACPYASESSRRFAGSAIDFFPDPKARPTHVDSLYAWKVARNCGGDPNCTTVPVPVDGCGQGIAKAGQMFVGFRAYVEPETKIGPAFSELYYDRVVRFTPEVPVISGLILSVNGTALSGNEVPAGTTVDIDFDVKPGASSGSLTWTAGIKGDDGCGELTPASGTPDAKDHVTTHLKVPAAQLSTLSILLDATDARGRRAKTVGFQVKYKSR